MSKKLKGSASEMQTYKQLKKRTRHDVMLEGNNYSYLAAGHFPTGDLEKILPEAMSVPSAEVMADSFPTIEKIDSMHPLLMMFSNCHNVHDVMTEIELRHYRELMFFIPVTYGHGNEQRLCSYVPVLYLEYLIGVIGGLYLGLRKEFHRRMEDVETETTKSFFIKGILNAKFEKGREKEGGELHPFFARVLENPTVTVSYFRRTRFYSTKVYPRSVLDASAEFEWNYKGSVINDNPHTFTNYAEYHFTTSQAMSYDNYFHPQYLGAT
tara:strand:+ start:758 stop:1558 length:801 start_codon:yes stop_codon:yes gene_type:complete